MASNQKTPGRDQDGKFSGSQQRSANRSTSQNNMMNQGSGRGWHGDSEGHAKAGRQSNKNK